MNLSILNSGTEPQQKTAVVLKLGDRARAEFRVSVVTGNNPGEERPTEREPQILHAKTPDRVSVYVKGQCVD